MGIGNGTLVAPPRPKDPSYGLLVDQERLSFIAYIPEWKHDAFWYLLAEAQMYQNTRLLKMLDTFLLTSTSRDGWRSNQLVEILKTAGEARVNPAADLNLTVTPAKEEKKRGLFRR